MKKYIQTGTKFYTSKSSFKALRFYRTCTNIDYSTGQDESSYSFK